MHSALHGEVKALLATCALLAACAPQVPASTIAPPSAAPTIPASTLSPTLAPPTADPLTDTPLPKISLEAGASYFSLDGVPRFVFSRNVAGYQQVQYATFLQWASEAGTTIARVQLDSMGMGYTASGEVDPNWLAQWDQVFAKAELDGIYILPVFSSWFDWNAGQGYSTWKSNPLNVANGGPVKQPAELFQQSSATQLLWLRWMRTLVQHWQARPNILAWEIFSEVNLASGVGEAAGLDFVDLAASVVRSADPQKRPVTASLADSGTWPNFYRKADIDFINVHPYPPSAQLDRAIIAAVRSNLVVYKRPVLIGESGLSADSPEKYPPNAATGVRHAIWAGLVSGAMNGRALYWEDSFALYFPALGLPWMETYKTMELPVTRFVDGLDFTGFKPLDSTSSSGVWGAALGNEQTIIGWYRDANSEPPGWPVKPLLSGQTVTLEISDSAAQWQVDFYDTRTGTQKLGSATVTPVDGPAGALQVVLALPDFTDDIAFKMQAVK